MVWCFSFSHLSLHLSTHFGGNYDNLYWEVIRSALGEHGPFSILSSGAWDYFMILFLFWIFLIFNSIYEKVVGLCSTTCMYHGRRLSDIHTRSIELFSFIILSFLCSQGFLLGSYVFCAVSVSVSVIFTYLVYLISTCLNLLYHCYYSTGYLVIITQSMDALVEDHDSVLWVCCAVSADLSYVKIPSHIPSD